MSTIANRWLSDECRIEDGIFSSSSEAFRSARVSGEFLIATSYEYPSTFHWEIPIFAPWSLKVVSHYG
jgi:hypothetical protein